MSGDKEAVDLEGDFMDKLDKGEDIGDSLRDLLGDDESAGEDADEASIDDGDKQQNDDGNTEAKAAPAESVAAAAKGEGGKPEAKADGQGSQTDEKGTFIATKDGSGTIPYAVLSGARQRASALETQLAQKEQELAAAREQLAKAAAASQAQTTQQHGSQQAAESYLGDGYTDEDIADLPEPVQKLVRDAQAMKAEIANLKNATQSVAATQQQSEQQVVQDAIDATPDLAEWQAKGGVLWEAAVRLDQQLRALPDWADKPMSARFAHVAAEVRKDIGLPPRQATTQQQTRRSTVASPENSGTAVPASISDIPGGSAPMLDSMDAVERTSTRGVAARFDSMRSADDIDSALARLLG